MILSLERILNKLIRSYRETCFQKHIGQRLVGLRIHGAVKIINYNIQAGKNLKLYPGVMIWGDGPVVLGDNVVIGNGTILYASKSGGGITIGDNTNIAAQGYIIDADHGARKGVNISAQENDVAPIKIGNDVWIAANCTILRGSVIEDGAIIGAKSLVKGKIDCDGIAVGIPAKVIKYRQNEGG